MGEAAKIHATQSAIEQLEAGLTVAVADARGKGATWDEVASALGVARQSAWRRFKEDKVMKKRQRRCSFCGDRQKDVRHLVLAPTGACICDECLDLAQSMVETERGATT